MHPNSDPTLDVDTRPADWHPQDWILVVEALCWFASDELIDEYDAALAHCLVDEIAAAQDMEGASSCCRPTLNIDCASSCLRSEECYPAKQTS